MNTARILDVIEQAIERGETFCTRALHTKPRYQTSNEKLTAHCTLGLLHLDAHSLNYEEAMRCGEAHKLAAYENFACQFTQKFDLSDAEINEIARLNDHRIIHEGFIDMYKLIKVANDTI